MTWTKHIQNGVVVFDEPMTLPEGTVVEVAVRDAGAATQPGLWERLHEVVGQAEGLPPDASARVDHYLTNETSQP